MKMFHALITIPILISSVITAKKSEARWRSMDEAPVEYKSVEIRNVIKKNGTSVSTHTTHAKCLLEGCRDNLGTLTIAYNKSVTRLREFSGSTLVDNKWTSVSRKNVDTRDAAGFGYGFDDIVRTMVAFPNVRVGTELKSRYVLDQFNSPIRSFYSNIVRFGDNAIMRKGAKVHYISEMPLRHETFGPEGYLEIKDWTQGPLYHKTVELKKDAYFAVSDEKSRDYFQSMAAGVLVSSHVHWGDLSRALAVGFERELTAPIPVDLANLATQIMSQDDNLIPRIDKLTTWLADHVRYMGDWRTVDGYFAPRSLSKIIETGFGDCKDYATVTTAVLRRMGYQASVATVYRGNYGYQKFDLPTLEAFNHAIVKVNAPDGNILWIDPTNSTSFAAGKRPDIAGKMALVIASDDSPELEYLPPVQPSDKITEVKTQLHHTTASLREQQSTATFRGIDALNLTGLELFGSKNDAKREILELAGINPEHQSEIKGPNLNSRQVTDLKFEIKTSGAPAAHRSTAGLIYSLNAVLPDLQAASLVNRVTAYRLGEVGLANQSVIIKGAHIVGEPPTKCVLESAWVHATRDIQNTEDGLMVITSTAIKKSSIHSEELQSPEVSAMIHRLRECFADLAIIYELD